ncbi:MAG TPA: hypothetical protein VJT67_14190 [Longimicrobiaceae bacterium]|nr:hypothetical protein [Longimicrobiaceae bacterium]
MHPDLEAAIEEMYAAFARPAPRAIDACTVCCFTEDELRTLVRTPLRELTPEQLGSYAFSALLTAGDEHDLRYFWPRMVELSARGELGVDLEVVFDKPRRGPQREQAAIERFARAQMADLARREYDFDAVDGWVCAFGRLFEDVLPLLAPLLEPTRAAAVNLFGLYSFNARRAARGTLINSFWDDDSENERRVAAWLCGDAVGDALARYYAEYAPDE